MRGVSPPVLPTVEGEQGDAAARTLARALLQRDPSPTTLKTVAQASTTAEMAALILGSPEFQRR
jgi:hypothetical protein